jgi:hypothetical protein
VHGCFELYMHRMCTIILLTTSVWPSVWGWKVVDLVSLVSNIDQRLDQNVLRNLLSRSEIMDCGIPKCTHTHSKKSLAVAFCCDTLLAGHHNGHLRESVDDHKNTVIAMLSRRKARHVIHGDGFPRSTRSRQRSI